MVNKKQKVFARVLCSILSVLIILGSFSLSAFAANVNNKYTIKQSPTHYKYIKYWGDDGSVASPSQRGWETFYKRTVTATGEAAYCLEFGKDFANGTSTDAVDLVDTAAWQNASNTAKRGVVLASIYGYPNSYSEYGDAGYYATQVIIWEYMLGYRTSASSDIYAGITGGYDENNKCCRFILSMQTKGYSDILEAYRGILTEMSKHTVKPHSGLDLACPINTPIVAANSGTVVKIDNACKTTYGKFIKIQSDTPSGTVYCIYAHLNQICVKEGDTVSAGSVIALSGNTGNTTGPHLHFGVKNSAGINVNPVPYLAKSSDIRLHATIVN